MKTRTVTLLLLLITALGFYLRLRTLTLDPVWLDEVTTIEAAAHPLWRMWTERTDPSPPLYFTLHKLLFPLPPETGWLRSISLVAGTLAIPAIFALGRALGGARVGLVAAALLAGLEGHIEYSQEARGYALLFLLVLLAALFLLRALQAPGARGFAMWLLAANVAMVLAALTHFTILPWILLAQGIALVHVGRGGAGVRLWPAYLGTSALTLLLAAPAINLLVEGLGTNVGVQWIERPDLIRLWAGLRGLVMLQGLGPYPAWIDPAVWALAALGVALAARHSWQRALVVLSLLVFPLALWTVSQIRPAFLPRTVLPGAIGLTLGLALVIARLPRVSGVLTVALLGLHVASTLSLEQAGRTLHDRTDQLVLLLRQGVQPGDVVVVDPFWMRGLLRHHLGDAAPFGMLAALRDGRALAYPAPQDETAPWPEVRLGGEVGLGEALAGARRVWVVRGYSDPERRANDALYDRLGGERRLVLDGPRIDLLLIER